MPTVKNIIDQKSGDVAAVSEGDSVFAAIQVMADRRIGCVVVKTGDHVVGIFSERDVINRVIAAEKDPRKTLVKEVMSSPVACCRLDTKLAECKTVMTEKKLRHLPVVEQGKLAGMISIGDITAREATDQETTIRYLHDYLYGRV